MPCRAGAARAPRTSRRPGRRSRGTSSPAPPASRSPFRVEDVEQDRALARRTPRGSRTTCASSPQATTDARCTNSCGAVPTFGRKRRSAAISVGVAGDEAAPEPGHRRALRERVERDDVRPVVELERRGRRLVEPELGVRLVRGEHEAVLARERREPLEERERGDGAGRVVRRVQPDERRASPDLVGHGVERWEEPVLLEQRKRDDTRAGERGAATGHRIAGLRDDDRVASAARRRARRART